MEENKILEDNIVTDSYYLINLFANDNKKVTQLHIQKLMYFFEAFYMCIKNTDSLYWIGTMNAIKNQAEEIVFSELIYF